MGSIWTVTTLVTKTRRSMKSRLAIKTKACTGKTNNQASFGKSLLKNSIEVEAVMELSRHLDETGSPTVIGFACLVCIKFASSLPVNCSMHAACKLHAWYGFWSKLYAWFGRFA